MGDLDFQPRRDSYSDLEGEENSLWDAELFEGNPSVNVEGDTVSICGSAATVALKRSPSAENQVAGLSDIYISRPDVGTCHLSALPHKLAIEVERQLSAVLPKQGAVSEEDLTAILDSIGRVCRIENADQHVLNVDALPAKKSQAEVLAEEGGNITVISRPEISSSVESLTSEILMGADTSSVTAVQLKWKNDQLPDPIHLIVTMVTLAGENTQAIATIYDEKGQQHYKVPYSDDVADERKALYQSVHELLHGFHKGGKEEAVSILMPENKEVDSSLGLEGFSSHAGGLIEIERPHSSILPGRPAQHLSEYTHNFQSDACLDCYIVEKRLRMVFSPSQNSQEQLCYMIDLDKLSGATTLEIMRSAQMQQILQQLDSSDLNCLRQGIDTLNQLAAAERFSYEEQSNYFINELRNQFDSSEAGCCWTTQGKRRGEDGKIDLMLGREYGRFILSDKLLHQWSEIEFMLDQEGNGRCVLKNTLGARFNFSLYDIQQEAGIDISEKRSERVKRLAELIDLLAADNATDHLLKLIAEENLVDQAACKNCPDWRKPDSVRAYDQLGEICHYHALTEQRKGANLEWYHHRLRRYRGSEEGFLIKFNSLGSHHLEAVVDRRGIRRITIAGPKKHWTGPELKLSYSVADDAPGLLMDQAATDAGIAEIDMVKVFDLLQTIHRDRENNQDGNRVPLQKSDLGAYLESLHQNGKGLLVRREFKVKPGMQRDKE